MRLTFYLAASLLALNACKMTSKTRTTKAEGHTLHHNGAFSPDGQWLVYDGRNDDTKIGETSTIGIVNVQTGEEKLIYRTQTPSLYGPGVGAATFSPVEETVIFIHGLPNADENKPYAMSRRTGVGIQVARPFEPLHFDARDLIPPYAPGSLRGGTHSHCWSADGQLISFTYNDEAVDPDLRTVGVMFPTPVQVETAPGNNSGSMYSAIVTEVVRDPRPGSDEINKAFDECWLGKTATLAFQGNSINAEGKQITEVYLVDIDTQKVLADHHAVGKEGERPKVPQGIQQRRLTRSKAGLSDTRHWLRSSPDGKHLYALAKDDQNRNQIVQIDAQSGEMKMLSAHDFSIDFTFNLSPDGKNIALIGKNSVFLYDIAQKTTTLLHDGTGQGKLVGAPNFSPTAKKIAFNQYVTHSDGQEYLQIRTVEWK